MSDFITLRTFTYPAEATIVRGRLEAEGIECFLKDQLTVAANPFLSFPMRLAA